MAVHEPERTSFGLKRRIGAIGAATLHGAFQEVCTLEVPRMPKRPRAPPDNRMPRVPRRLRGTRAIRRTHEVTARRGVAVHPAGRRFTPSAQIYRNRRTDAASSPAVDDIAFRSVGSVCLACFASTVSPHAPYALPVPSTPCPARSACLVCSTYPRVPHAPHASSAPSIRVSRALRMPCPFHPSHALRTLR